MSFMEKIHLDLITPGILTFANYMLNSLIKCIHYTGPLTEDGKLEKEISQIKKLTKNITCLSMMNLMLFSR